MQQLYLRRDVQIEPLVDQWYAWPHLIPPATAARNLTERHLRIMESYISSPQVHARAVRDPKMLGGPFIDYGGERVAEVRDLLQRTVAERAELLALSKALEEVDRLLDLRAKGESLHPLYALVPDRIKGCMELVYNRSSHPSYRLIEPLLYRSEFYTTANQSFMLSRTMGDARPFILSTPRLRDPGCVEVKLPFKHHAIDYLFSAKTVPRPFENLTEECCVSQDDRAVFASFFTPDEPKPYCRYSGSGVRWRYFGHACILVETADVSVLFDPILSYTYESTISRYTYDDLPENIDYAVITHNHQDHLLFETLFQLRHKIGCTVVPRNGNGSLVDPSLRLTLENVGFKNIVELDEFQIVEFKGGMIMGIPFLGEHADLDIRTKLAYLVQLKGQKLLFAADSCNIEPCLYHRLHREVGDVRTLFVGMECDGAPLSWLYGPLLAYRPQRAEDVSRRLSGSNFTQASEMVKCMNCREVFVYAMGQEPWLNHVMSLKYSPESHPIVQSNRLIESCRERGILAERLFGEREMLLD